MPACVEACEYEATIFGTRSKLLAEARDRIEEDPDEYYDHIYGETEIGGTSVLFLTPKPEDAVWATRRSWARSRCRASRSSSSTASRASWSAAAPP